MRSISPSIGPLDTQEPFKEDVPSLRFAKSIERV